ncbi:MAG TPA: CoA transferase [Chloroflexota bacterium]|jgi:crotonobetainyl-CoA:carnitine CoA-transferase CaiB-like acyl-CoA transferase
MPGALEDVRVLDFTHALNGPFCTMLLGHLGAEIIKIEPPQGDNFRRIWMPPNSPVDAWEFMNVNTNKKSVAIDLKNSRGQELARRLIALSDVLVENYHTGALDRFGLGYEAIRELNPRLIYACTRGYGEDGPYASYGSTAGTNNGMTGWTHTAWLYGNNEGTRAHGIGDEGAGVSMALGILAALHARDRTGQGQKIEVSMQEAVLGFMTTRFHEHYTGNKVGFDPVKVGDGWFTLRVPEMSDQKWRELAAILGVGADDPRFASDDLRRKNGKELHALLLDWTRDRTRQEIWDKLQGIGYVGAPVLAVEEVMQDQHVKARKAFSHYEHPVAGPLTLLNPWIRMSETPSSIRAMAPRLGEHTDSVLTDVLGLATGEVEDLRASSVVR